MSDGVLTNSAKPPSNDTPAPLDIITKIRSIVAAEVAFPAGSDSIGNCAIADLPSGYFVTKFDDLP
jgi:hypothetical protein